MSIFDFLLTNHERQLREQKGSFICKKCKRKLKGYPSTKKHRDCRACYVWRIRGSGKNYKRYSHRPRFVVNV